MLIPVLPDGFLKAERSPPLRPDGYEQVQHKTIDAMDNKNMEIYNRVRTAPEEALRKIEGGKLKGKSDINPMWRIATLTEIFGPAGQGWYIDVIRKWTESAPDGETKAFVDINLYVKYEGEWSKPIHGTGGSTLLSIRTTGSELNDEAFKMAYTDAISVACKSLGMAADVYWASGASKYGSPSQGKVPVQQPRSPGKPELTPESVKWLPSVTQAMKLDIPNDELIRRITSKYTLSEENITLLLKQSNRLPQAIRS